MSSESATSEVAEYITHVNKKLKKMETNLEALQSDLRLHKTSTGLKKTEETMDDVDPVPVEMAAEVPQVVPQAQTGGPQRRFHYPPDPKEPHEIGPWLNEIISKAKWT